MDTLHLFNQQVLQCQDDAYTLAWYLLGDEIEAEAIVQKSVEAAYQCFSERQGNCRLLILKQIVEQCQSRGMAASRSVEPGIFPGLYFLAHQERVVLILIDVFEFRYCEAARIINLSLSETGRLLATARWKMKDHQKVAA